MKALHCCFITLVAEWCDDSGEGNEKIGGACVGDTDDNDDGADDDDGGLDDGDDDVLTMRMRTRTRTSMLMTVARTIMNMQHLMVTRWLELLLVTEEHQEWTQFSLKPLGRLHSDAGIA